MANLNLMPSDLPVATTPLGANDPIIVQQGNGGVVSRTTPSGLVDTVAPVATMGDAQAGTNNSKRMTPLRTKEAIASEVGVSIASFSQGELANTAVQPTLTLTAGAGLTGGGTLAANRTFALNSTSIASLALADTSLQNLVAGDNITISGTGSVRTISTASAPQIQTDWNATTGIGAILNKPNLGAMATKNNVSISDIDATGTPNSGTFLRGDGTWGTVAGSGTVTSVAMTVPTGLSIAGSPITGSGTLAVTYTSGYQGYTTVEATKLSGIAAGATANQTNAYLLNRANHTGTQAIGTVDGLQTALDGKLSISSGTALSSNTIDTQLQIRGGGNRVVRFQKADGTRAGAVSSNGDNSSVEIFVDNPTNTVSKTFRCNSDGQLILPDSPNLAGSATRKDYVDAAVAGAGGLGIGQTWQDVTASRASNTSYQNTSGKPIAVAITMDGTPTTLRLEFQVSSNNSTWYWLSDLQPYNASAAINKFFGGGVVPDGYYYRAIRSAANTWRWMELR